MASSAASGRARRPGVGSGALLLVWGLLGAGCADNECNFHSQCGPRRYCDRGACRQDCRADFDCADGLRCDAIGRCVPPGEGVDAAVDAGRDAQQRPDARPPRDAARETGGGRDAGSERPPPPPPPDASRDAGSERPTGGTKRYLDSCGGDSECASGRCGFDLGGRRACSRSCTSQADCAHGHLCSPAGWCEPSDVGTACSVASPDSCVLGLCLGRAGGSGYCTRSCERATDCPAGYACTDVGGQRVCVDIEKPCTAGGTECETGLCIAGIGCTASCRSAADCPTMFTGLGAPPYTCGTLSGASGTVCIPPDLVMGDRAIGQGCGLTASGGNQCRSAVCDDATPVGAACTQACTPQGGCPPGFGCQPQAAGGTIVLGCVHAGALGFGQPCSRGADCATAICEGTSARCSRLCNDGLCPDGWRCQPVPGYPISICRPPG